MPRIKSSVSKTPPLKKPDPAAPSPETPGYRTLWLILAALVVIAAVVIALPLLQPAPAAKGAAPASGLPNGSISIIYFYGDTCSHCAKVRPVLDEIGARYPDVSITRLEIYSNQSNIPVFDAMSRAAGIPDAGVPLLFVGSKALYGDREIIAGLEPAVIAERERLAACNTTTQPVAVNTTPSCTQPAPAITLPVVIGAALVDSANPCGLSVLVFLLLSMAAAGKRERILLVGGAYITAMFLFHLLVGIGLFSVFSLSGLAKTFALIGGAIALVLGLITIIDVLRKKETFLLSIPDSRKGLLGEYARRASLPAAFVLGVLAGILGFSCTGGIYISILGLMGRDMAMMTGLPWLVLYNFVYILPLLLLTLLVAFGLSPERAETLRTDYKMPLRLLIGVVLIALGLVILAGWMG